MQQIYTWVQRKFDFHLTAEMYIPAVERVRGTPARIEERVESIPRDLLTKKGSDEVWSIQENIGHLLSLEPLWATRLSQFIEGLPELLAWEETNSSTWDSDYNSRPMKEILTAFRTARQLLVSQLDQISDEIIERVSYHPRLKTPMRTIDLVYFVSEHDDYHLAQVTRLLKEHSEKFSSLRL